VQVSLYKETKLEPQVRAMFTGGVSSAPIGDAVDGNSHINVVKFDAGGRTKWHTHPFAQALIVVEGKGIVATEDKENVVEPGDVVIIPAGQKHWHGATETTSMAHVNVNGNGEAQILEAVDKIRTQNP
jgi:quercetin dioxygenase-like cupin family protein